MDRRVAVFQKEEEEREEKRERPSKVVKSWERGVEGARAGGRKEAGARVPVERVWWWCGRWWWW